MTRFYTEFTYIEQCPFIYVVFKYIEGKRVLLCTVHTVLVYSSCSKNTESHVDMLFMQNSHTYRSQSPFVTRNLCKVHVQREQNALMTCFLHRVQVHKTDSIDYLVFEQSSSTKTTKQIYNALFLQFSRTQKQISQIIQSGEPFDDTVF